LWTLNIVLKEFRAPLEIFVLVCSITCSLISFCCEVGMLTLYAVGTLNARAASKMKSMATDLSQHQRQDGSDAGTKAVTSARTPTQEITYLVLSFVLTLFVLGMNVYGLSRLLAQLRKAAVRVRHSVTGRAKSGQSTPRQAECTMFS
jgi:hypothetical protein